MSLLVKSATHWYKSNVIKYDLDLIVVTLSSFSASAEQVYLKTSTTPEETLQNIASMFLIASVLRSLLKEFDSRQKSICYSAAGTALLAAYLCTNGDFSGATFFLAIVFIVHLVTDRALFRIQYRKAIDRELGIT